MCVITIGLVAPSEGGAPLAAPGQVAAGGGTPSTTAPVASSAEAKTRRPGLPIADELLGRKLLKRDPALTISVDSVFQSLKEKDRATLVDTRDADEFQKLRIPGSINIPLHTIKSKTFLKSKHLVLIDQGHSYFRLEKECRRLRESGFRVSILDGGLSSWSQQGGALEGSTLEQKMLSKISFQAFHTERNYENWVVLNMSDRINPDAARWIPESLHINGSDSLEKIITAIEALRDKNHKIPFLAFLIYTDCGNHYDRLEKLFQKVGVTNAFFLEGGLQAYEPFWNSRPPFSTWRIPL
jgi:rhodanese-related sulfurtransferase